MNEGGSGWVGLYQALHNTLGTVRGYRRTAIRRQVRHSEKRTAPQVAATAQKDLDASVADAVQRFPEYAKYLLAHGCSLPRPGERVDPGSLPIWTRECQQSLFRSLQEPPVLRATVHSTGGSTGVPLSFYITRESYEWRAAVTDRGYRWAGAEEGQKSIYVWGSPMKPLTWQQRCRTGAHHYLQRRRFFNSFTFGEEEKRRCCEAINDWKPRAIVGYAGSLVDLAGFVKSHRSVLKWRAGTVVTAAEGLRPEQRETLKEYLGDEVFMSYGSREFMLIGMECRRHRGYHINSDNVLVEVVDEEGNPVPAGCTGRILVTDLHNRANPFIRYEIGDLGVASGELCDCGSPFPLLGGVEGRAQESIIRPDGSSITAMLIPHMMKEFRWVEGYQIEQCSVGRVDVKLRCAEALAPEKTEPIVRELKRFLGAEMRITFTRVERLHKNTSGKTPIVISKAAR